MQFKQFHSSQQECHWICCNFRWSMVFNVVDAGDICSVWPHKIYHFHANKLSGFLTEFSSKCLNEHTSYHIVLTFDGKAPRKWKWDEIIWFGNDVDISAHFDGFPVELLLWDGDNSVIDQIFHSGKPISSRENSWIQFWLKMSVIYHYSSQMFNPLLE